MEDEKVGTETEPQPAGAPTRPPKKRLPLWGKILLGVLVVLLALVALAGLYINGKLDLIRYSDGSVTSAGSIDATEDQELDGAGLAQNTGDMVMPEGSPFQSDDVLNILLISTDERTDAVNDADAFTHLNELDGTSGTTEFSEDARADSLILVSLNIKQDTIRLVSIERGTGVPIDLEGYEGEYDWITHTFRYGGAKLTMDTVESCFNVAVDHYVRINFNSFVQIVDAVGGVDINLTELEAQGLNWEVPSNSMLIVNKVAPGLNHFDGYTALQYARLRKIDNDWNRIARQRTVIQAVLDQIKDASIGELDNLLDTVLPLVQTNFTKTEIAALLTQLPDFLGVTTEQLSLPAADTYGVRTGMDNRLMYDPDWAANRRLLHRFLYGATSDSDIKSYLRDSSSAIDWDAGLTDAQFGNADYGVFLAGAAGTEDTADSDAAMKRTLLRYLHENQGVNVFLTPDSFSTGLLLNEYIGGGDSALLDRYLEQSSYETVAETEQIFWQWLRRYNLAQAQNSRITVVGLGPEPWQQDALTSLALLLDDSADLREEMQAVADAIREQTPDAVAALEQALNDRFYAARKMFGANWPAAKQLLANMTRSGDALTSADGRSADGRSAAMLDNFDYAQAQDPDAKFFGQFAMQDVMQSGCALDGGSLENLDTTSFAMRLAAQDAPAAGQVCSILALYLDGEPIDGLAAQSPLGSYLPKALAADTIVSLDATATPFDTQNGFFADGAEKESKPATAYFQKVITVTPGDAEEETEPLP